MNIGKTLATFTFQVYSNRKENQKGRRREKVEGEMMMHRFEWLTKTGLSICIFFCIFSGPEECLAFPEKSQTVDNTQEYLLDEFIHHHLMYRVKVPRKQPSRYPPPPVCVLCLYTQQQPAMDFN